MCLLYSHVCLIYICVCMYIYTCVLDIDMKLLPCQPPNTKEVMAGYSLQPSVYLEDVEDDGLVGDLPQFFPFGGPLSPGSVSCRTLPRSLPSQLHRKKTLSRWNRRVIDASVLGSDDFGGHNRVSRSSTNSTGPKIPLCAAMPVERRFSVRSTECVFRYKQIVVKKCHRYTQIWLDSQTVVKNAINPQVGEAVAHGVYIYSPPRTRSTLRWVRQWLMVYIYIVHQEPYIYIIQQLVNKCQFSGSTLLNYAYPFQNWTFQCFARAAQKKGRNGTNKKSDTRWESNPGPRLF